MNNGSFFFHYRKIWLFATALFLCSCKSKTEYPQELVMADSAYMQGNYILADALLEAHLNHFRTGDKETAMYTLLVEQEKECMHGNLQGNYLLIDSLCRYYHHSGFGEKYAKAINFKGIFYLLNKNYPGAIDCFLEAQKIVGSIGGNSRLECIIARNLGDVYFDQRMLNDCIPYYRRYYQLAVSNNDTLRMAYGARCMGRVCSILNDVDSVIFYYKQSIALGEKVPQRDNIVPFTKDRLCDIYIQTEQFDKALELMPRDSLNDANWAYWHYGQHNLDSAAYYFQKTLGRYKWWGEVETLRILAEIEEQQGDLRASLGYYRRLAEAEDSLMVQQRAEETMRTEAQFNYTGIQQERDRLEHHNASLRQQNTLLGVVAVASVAVILLLWMTYRQRRRTVRERLERLEMEREEQARQSSLQQEENRRQLDALQQQLDEARRQDDAARAERLQMEAEVLATENENIEARQRRKEALLKELKQTPLYQRLKAPAQEGDHHMSEADWQELSTRLDEIYELGPRLLGLACLSETELRICYLLKLDVATTDIADILCRSKSAVSMAKQRMVMKLTGRRGKADMLDELIVGFGG